MDEQKKNQLKQRKNILKIILLLLFLAASVFITIKIFPYILALKEPENQQKVQQYISSFGAKGWFIVLGVQVLQVIIAIIPGEPVELIAGLLYGTLGGLITCLIGILVGSMLVFYLVRFLGYGLVTALVGEEKLKQYKFLQNTKRLETITFILFFIPGTPKDILTYVAGLTTIQPLRFFIIATFARIPSVVTSTLAGATLGSGQLGVTLLIFAITGLIGIGGIYLHNYMMKKLNHPQ